MCVRLLLVFLALICLAAGPVVFLGGGFPGPPEPGVAVCRVNTGTGTGNIDLTCAGIAWAPAAAQIYLSYAVTDNTFAIHAGWAVGFTDCTEQTVEALKDEDATGGNTDSSHTGQTTQTLWLPLATTGAVDGAAAIVSCITGGIRVSVSDAFAASYLGTLVLFRGNVVDTVDTGTYVGDATIGNSVNVTEPGFEAETVFVVSTRDALDNTNRVSAFWCFGVADRTGGTWTQGSQGWSSQDNVVTSAVAAHLSTAEACQSCGAGDCVSPATEIGTHASGFTATTRAQSSAATYAFMAIKWKVGVQHWAGVLATPTVTGNTDYTAPGWQPAGGILWMTRAAVVDTTEQDGDAGTLGVAVFDGDTAVCQAITAEDGTTVPNTASLSDDQIVRFPTHQQGALFVGTHSILSNGLRINFSATDTGVVRQWYGWMLKL